MDIINSRGDRGCGPVDGLDHKHIGELLDTLEWFSAWRVEANARGNLQNFITRESFEDMNWMILGVVCGISDLLGGGEAQGSVAWRPGGEGVRLPRYGGVGGIGGGGGVGGGGGGGGGGGDGGGKGGRAAVEPISINLASLMQDICEHHFANTRQAQPGSNPGAAACDASDVRGNAVRVTWEGRGKTKGRIAGRNTSHSPMTMDNTRSGVGLRRYDPRRQEAALILGRY